MRPIKAAVRFSVCFVILGKKNFYKIYLCISCRGAEPDKIRGPGKPGGHIAQGQKALLPASGCTGTALHGVSGAFT